MSDWETTFLITGFVVEGPPVQFGSVRFSSGSAGDERDGALRESARAHPFDFDVSRFSRASVRGSGDSAVAAAKAARFEIDRTLDLLAFTEFGLAKFLPIACSANDTGATVPLKPFTSFRPMPLGNWPSQPVMQRDWLSGERGFVRHLEHLLEKPSARYSESEEALSAGLRWCRLGSLARSFSESVTVAFVMEWLALESMILRLPNERVTEALNRLPRLLKYWPTTISMNYSPDLRSPDPIAAAQEWQAVINRMYWERKDIFHGREFHMPTDPEAPPSWEQGATTFAILEAILGRTVAFLGKSSKASGSMLAIWDSVDAYVPDSSDCPPTNLGGWTSGWS